MQWEDAYPTPGAPRCKQSECKAMRITGPSNKSDMISTGRMLEVDCLTMTRGWPRQLENKSSQVCAVEKVI